MISNVLWVVSVASAAVGYLADKPALFGVAVVALAVGALLDLGTES